MKVYKQLKRNHVTWFGNLEDLTWWDQAGPADPHELFQVPSEIHWNIRAGEDVVSACLGFGEQRRDVIIKWRKVSGMRFLKGLFRPSKAASEFNMGMKLLLRGVFTPKPILWGEVRPMGAVLEEYLVMERALDVLPLPKCLWRTARSPVERRRLLEATARAVREVHDAGILHGDLNSSNILIKKTDSSYRATLIDFAGSKDLVSLSDLHREKDLSRFLRSLLPHVREEDKSFFRSVYAGHSKG